MKRANLSDRMKRQTETFINGDAFNTSVDNKETEDVSNDINAMHDDKQCTTQYTDYKYNQNSNIENNNNSKYNIKDKSITLDTNNSIDTSIDTTTSDSELNIKQNDNDISNNSIHKLTIQKPDIVEPYNNRLVANVTKSQKAYVKKIAKSFENESAFVRFMIDYFRKNVEIK